MALLSVVETADPRATPRKSGNVGFEEETRAFLQGRLRMLTGALAVFTLVLLCAFITANVISSSGPVWAQVVEDLFYPPNNVVTILLVFTAGLHQLLQRKRLSAGALFTLDAVFFEVLIIPVLVLYASRHTFSFSGFAIVLPFLCFVILTRGVLVPSTALRTVVLSAPAPIGVLAIQLSYGASFAFPDQPYPQAHFVDMVMQNQLLLLGSIGVAAVASRVNLGLRQRSYQAAQLGQYEIHGSIGAGAMGEVFLARHAMLKRPTAVKLLRPDITGAGVLKRFEQEVQQTSRLTHPNTVEIFDYGHTPEGVFYYAMEYLDGADLREIVELDGPMSPGRAIYVLSAACGALGEAHSKGIVHRDIKPANIMLCEQGGEHDVVKILDFGLVKNMGALADADAAAGPSDEKRVIGTPETMAPEAVRESGVSRLSDIYSLAVVGYFLLTGKPIFDAETVAEFIRHHQVSRPIPPSQRVDGVPADLEAVIMKCLAKDPGQRPTSALVFRKQLLQCQDAGTWIPDDAGKWWKSWFERYPRSELQEMAVEFRSGGSFTSGDRAASSSGERTGMRSFGSLDRTAAPSFVTIDGRNLDDISVTRGPDDDDEASLTRWETQL